MNQPQTNPTPAAEKPASVTSSNSTEHKAAEAKLHDLAPEIRKQWTKLSDADLAGVTGQDDLTKTVEKAYAVSHDDAKKQVQSWAQGRQF